MRLVANIISVIFHPMFLVMAMFGIIYMVNPYLFPMTTSKVIGLIIISITTMTIIFPMISIVLMKNLGLIDSIEMKDKKERVGPLIATGVFYLWLYMNIRSNNIVPQAFTFFVLGSTIALFIAFFLNNFTKVSLHTVGIGGFIMGLILILNNFSYEFFTIQTLAFGTFIINTDLLLIISILVAGLIGTARLLLKAHNTDQVYGGYIIGVAAQLIAYVAYF